MNQTQTPVKIFITGATGYIGGAILNRLLETTPDRWQITALTRTEVAGKKLQELGVTPLLGSLDDSEILTKASTDADVVINTADADHLPAAKAIVKGLASGGKRRILIHTSGTGVLADDSKGNFTSEKVYNDLKVEDIHALPLTQAHKDVDQYIFDNAKGFEAIIVAPPTIYGISNGPFNTHSQQIPNLIRTFLKKGAAATVGKGINIWNHVHVEDLADFYVLLLQKALEGKASTGHEGWYFCESGEHYLKDLVAKIGEEMYKQGAIKQAEVVEFAEGEPEEYLGKYVWMAIASNSRCRSDRARALGWEAKREAFYESLEAEVKGLLVAAKKP